jgi:Na+-transporting NADH:ubiquinone oxidoreductase subunit A
MAHLIKTKRGLDIKIEGKAKETLGRTIHSDVVALVPDYFVGIVPKMLVKPGDAVKAGTPVFHDKTFADMNFVSPVSGTIVDVVRGERRKILAVTIKRDGKTDYEKFPVKSLAELSRDKIKELMLAAGVWPFIKQRPYDIVADPTKQPNGIFISGFDSSPLAPDYDFILGGKEKELQCGIDVLAKLTDGNVHLGLKAGNKSPLAGLKNVQITEYDGPHPIGNVGIQIHHTNPINKGDIYWTVNIQNLLFIGRLFLNGTVDFSYTVALTGPEVNEDARQYYQTILGTSIAPFIKGNVSAGIPLRYITGNVLTGIKINENEYLHPYASQITVIDEGSETHEILGWAMPRFDKFSASNLFLAKIFGKLGINNFKYDARILGGERPIIVSNEYDKVLPMDILPEFLIKAMITGNIDKMEALGAYEIAPEDLALCEFVCTSKLPIQEITRKALNNLKSEVE